MSVSKLIALMMDILKGKSLPKIALLKLILSTAGEILGALDGAQVEEGPLVAMAPTSKNSPAPTQEQVFKEIDQFCNATPPADAAAAPSGQLLKNALKLLLQLLLSTAAK